MKERSRVLVGDTLLREVDLGQIPRNNAPPLDGIAAGNSSQESKESDGTEEKERSRERVEV